MKFLYIMLVTNLIAGTVLANGEDDSMVPFPEEDMVQEVPQLERLVPNWEDPSLDVSALRKKMENLQVRVLPEEVVREQLEQLDLE